MARLRVKTGRDEGRIYELDKESFLLGRDGGDIAVADKAASRKHCEVFRIGEMFFAKDLESRNGTFVNDGQIDEQILQVGDKIRIGATIYVFEDDADPFEDNIHDDLFGDAVASNSTVEIQLDPKMFGAGEVNASQAFLTFFHRMSGTLAGGGHLRETIKTACDLIKDFLKADLVAAFTIEDDGSDPKVAAVIGKDSGVKISETIIGRVVEQKQALLSRNAMEDARFKGTQSIVAKQVESFLAVPMAAQEQVHGVIYLGRSALNGSFSEDDLETMSIVGLQMGLAFQSLTAQKRNREMFINTIKLLTSINEGAGNVRKGASQRIMSYAIAIAEELRLPQADVRQIQIAALLQDIGRLGLPEPKSDEGRVEQDLKAAVRGRKMLANVPGFEEVSVIVGQQLERFDGSGRPDGLSAKQIPLAAAIVGCASEFDYMCTVGGLRGDGLPLEKVLKTFYRKANHKYDARVIKALLISHKKGRLYEPELVVLEDV